MFFAVGTTDLSTWWRPLILGFALLALVNNVLLFNTFNQRANGLDSILANPASLREPVYIIGLDWSSESDFSSRVSPSINAMSFVPLYALAERHIPYGIFETGLVTMKDSLRLLHPEIRGSDIQAWYASMFSDPHRFLAYHSILLFADRKMGEEAEKRLSGMGFMTRFSSPGWRLLLSSSEDPQ